MTAEQKKKYEELIASGMSHEDALAAVGGGATPAKKSALDSAMETIEKDSGEVTSLSGRYKGKDLPVVDMKGNGRGNTQVPGRDPAIVAAEEEEKEKARKAKTISPEEEAKFREKHKSNSLLGKMQSLGRAAAEAGPVYGAIATGDAPRERDVKSPDFVELPKGVRDYGNNLMNKGDRKLNDINTADLSEHQHRLYQMELERTGSARDAYAFATDPKNTDVKPYGPTDIGLGGKDVKWGEVDNATRPEAEDTTPYPLRNAPGVEPYAPRKEVTAVITADPLTRAVTSVAVETGEVDNGSVDENGLPVGYLQRTAMVESGGRDNATNPNSSATGRYQFTKKTANALGYTLEDMKDPEKAEEAMVKLTKQHQAAFSKVMGRAPTSDELYMMHQQGQGRAMKVFKGDQDANAVSVLGEDEVLNNGGNANMTVGEYREYWKNRYNNFDGKPAPLQLRPATSDQALGATGVAEVTPPGTVANIVSQAEADELGAHQRPAPQAGDVTPPTNTPREFQFGNYKQTEGQSLFASLVAMGLTYLGGRALGGDAGEALAAGLIAGTHTFGNSLNRNVRAQNIEYLLEQGMAPETIDQWIMTGDPKALEQKKTAEWKSVGDGTGRLWRTKQDGTVEFSNATKQNFQTVVVNDAEYAAYTNEDGSIKRDREGNPLLSHQTKASTKGSGSRNETNVSYSPVAKDGSRIKTTNYSDGTTKTETVLPGADVKKEGEADDKAQREYKEGMRSYETLKGRANTLIAKLEEGGVTGPIDSTFGYVYQKSGVDVLGGKKATEVKKDMKAIINDLLPEYKKILGSGITDADMAWMQSVDDLSWTDDEQANIMSLNNILAKMDARIKEATAQAADRGWVTTPPANNAPAPQGQAPLFKVVG